ncbi:hypothetical protein E4U09_005603 [Claviceps aff. purpurea]|uniref:Uncharacterized protein n=1 Tax=Claviceps aff. purpurea TaxID=1967640 RepID=A0A9P7QP54_9HYPO|nr:hypothetical protein E4U09_005603 [Claviceps aff. purpurea]
MTTAGTIALKAPDERSSILRMFGDGRQVSSPPYLEAHGFHVCLSKRVMFRYLRPHRGRRGEAGFCGPSPRRFRIQLTLLSCRQSGFCGPSPGGSEFNVPDQGFNFPRGGNDDKTSRRLDLVIEKN